MLSVLVFCVQNASAVQDPYQQVLDLQKQARAGDAGAQYLLGFMYDEGQGVAKDPQEAIKWYTQAAKQGHSDAQLTLGFMYAEGRGVAKDQPEAIKWYTKAAQQENGGAQLILGMMLAEANDTPEYLTEALRWTLQAEINGEDVANFKTSLQLRMTPEQIAEAEKRAIVVKPSEESNGPVRYISELEGFSLLFPSPPQRTIVQDNERLLAIHYQSIPNDSPVQYNASFQYFKKAKLLDEPSRKGFLEDYLVGRAMFAWKNRIQKKELTFRGFNAAHFKHTVFSAGTETIHEGLIFIANGNFVSLSCVYPADISPNPSFQNFVNSFEGLHSQPSVPNVIESPENSLEGS